MLARPQKFYCWNLKSATAKKKLNFKILTFPWQHWNEKITIFDIRVGRQIFAEERLRITNEYEGIWVGLWDCFSSESALPSDVGGSVLRLVFTSDEVGVVVGIVRELTTMWKSKVGVVSGVISSTESESEESERFHFFRFRLRLRHLWSSEN